MTDNEQTITTHVAEPIQVTVTRNAAGNWQLEVSIKGSNGTDIFDQLKNLMDPLQAEYPAPPKKATTL